MHNFLDILDVALLTRLSLLATSIVEVFEKCSSSLKFTFEVQQDDSIQFLDLRLSFSHHDHICWAYMPRTKKKVVLPFDSSHYKVIKRGIAKLCLSSALVKSCPHRLAESFSLQTERLQQAGVPPSALTSGRRNASKPASQGARGRCRRSFD